MKSTTALRQQQVKATLKVVPSINFQAKKTSDNLVLILAYINFGYKLTMSRDQIMQHIVRNSYQELITKKKPDFTKSFAPQKIDKYIPLYVSTGVSMLYSEWNKKTKMADDAKANDQLNRFKIKVEKLYKQLTNNGADLTPDYFKKQIVKYVLENKFDPIIQQTPVIEIQQPIPNEEKNLFSDFVDEQINLELKKAKTKASKKIQVQSLNRYSYFLDKLIEYDKVKPIYIEDINNKTIESISDEFFFWLQEYGMKERGKYYEDSTMNKERVSFKKYLRKAKPFNLSFDNIREVDTLKKQKLAEKQIIYLNVHELGLLEKVDCSFLESDLNRNEYEYEIVKLFFLLSAWGGGRRISDYSKWFLQTYPGTNKYFVGDIPTKNEKYVNIRVGKNAIRIWNKLMKMGKNKLPVVPNHYNKMIQSICQAAKINESIVLNKEGERVEKWTKVTSHVARKSYCNNFIYEFKRLESDVATDMGIDISTMRESYLSKDNSGANQRMDELFENFPNV